MMSVGGEPPSTLILPLAGEEISPFPFYEGRLEPALSAAEGMGVRSLASNQIQSYPNGPWNTWST